MKNAFVIGVVLVLLGALGLVYDKINFTTKEKKADLGPIEIVQEKDHKVEIPKIAGIVTLAAGMVLIVYGAKRTMA